MEIEKTCGTCVHWERSPQLHMGACMHGPLQCILTEQGYVSIHPPAMINQTCHQWKPREEQATGQGDGQEQSRLIAG